MIISLERLEQLKKKAKGERDNQKKREGKLLRGNITHSN